ncbi:MAG TPA: metallopeptidase TldD-related protein [Candidatus Acidoferrales bacterium]|jgi:predicted Zn-dependent protease|nr:metallopeptidase TldD-related protein [Candidatus Acidoferrales bacterium]
MKNATKTSVSNLFLGRFLAWAAVAALALTSGGPAAAAPARHPTTAFAQPQQTAAADSDHTLAAMQDELDRARTRLELTIPGTNEPARPYFIQYRVLDLDVRTIVAEFGALVTSTAGRNRIMSVDVRVGNDNLDSSNFITDEGFSGFLGSTGTIGIDRDYDSLRQDLWLATDQAFKAAVENYSKKQAFMSRLAKAPSIPDFSPATPTVSVEPLHESDWTTRNWEQEARTVSAVLRQFPQLYSSRVTYHLIYTTSYLLNSDGTKIRVNHSLAAIEASLETESDDGMALHNYYAVYRHRPDQLPAVDAVKKDLETAGEQLITLRVSPPAADYDGPVLFEAPAAGSLLAQMLGPSLSGARGPLAMQSAFDQLMDRLGGRSEWTGKLGSRVLPGPVSLLDDPTAKQFQGRDLLGTYDVDEEGVKAERVELVNSGLLLNFLMSRRPGPDLDHSNGHGRAAYLGDPRPMASNLFFTSSSAISPDELKKKFMDDCKQNGNKWCIIVRAMDNPVLGVREQEDLSDIVMGAASGAATGDRLPLLVYRVDVADGRESLIRGARLAGLTLRAVRNIAAVGNDEAAFDFMQSQQAGFAGTALAAFGSADSGVPSTVIAPSLLLDDVEVHGARGEPERLPLVPPPPIK